MDLMNKINNKFEWKLVKRTESIKYIERRLIKMIKNAIAYILRKRNRKYKRDKRNN